MYETSGEKNHAALVAYHLQQLDCCSGNCKKFAVVGVVNKWGDLYVYCREHARSRTLEVLDT